MNFGETLLKRVDVSTCCARRVGDVHLSFLLRMLLQQAANVHQDTVSKSTVEDAPEEDGGPPPVPPRKSKSRDSVAGKVRLCSSSQVNANIKLLTSRVC